jgi:murein DD-endopeptidase MepM/ murein hydrolase activator NlpD
MPPPKVGSSIGPAPAFNFEPVSDSTPVAIVQLGETSFSEIAKRLGIDKDSLREANPQISDPTGLKVGQQVFLPGRVAPPPEASFGFQQPPSNSLSQSSPPILAKGDPLAKAMVQMHLADGAPQSQTAFRAPVQPDKQIVVQTLGGGAEPVVAGPVTPNSQPVQFTSKTALASNQQLENLARDPGEAHVAWKQLTEPERKEVLAKMEARYGKPFVQQFLEVVKKGTAQVETQNYQPGSGPSPERLRVLGYHLAWKVVGNASIENEFWVHPSGKTVQRDVSTWTQGTVQPAKPAKSDAVPDQSQTSGNVESADPSAELEDKQEKAESVLNRLQDNTNQLESLLKSNPVPWEQVKEKFMRCNDLQGQLKALGASSSDPAAASTLDMSQVDEYFYEEQDTANQQLLDLRTKADDLNSNFEDLMQQPSVVEPGDAE